MMDINVLINRLIYEKNHKIRNGVFGELSRKLAYNSNKIEGSTLTEKQTAALFNTGSLNSEDDNYYIKSKDIEEMTGHFIMFNKMLDTYNEPLTIDLIKEYHYCLKAGVFEDRLNGYVAGEFKKYPNRVGGSDVERSKPSDVASDLINLLDEYNKLNNVDILDLAKFHNKYEMIHPFQDGNGRTGRIILFKECLKNNMMPIILSDDNRLKYYNALEKAHHDDYDMLVDLFNEEQNNTANLINVYFQSNDNLNILDDIDNMIKGKYNPCIDDDDKDCSK